MSGSSPQPTATCGRWSSEGRFREDLYYRLHVINIYLPPLRERKDDIPYLAQHFLEKYSAENSKRDPRSHGGRARSDDGVRLARQRPRARERDRAGGRPQLGPSHRPRPRFRSTCARRRCSTSRNSWCRPKGISFKDVITNVEKRLIESTLEAAGGVQKRAAELLKIKPTTLNEMIKRYEIGTRRRKGGTEETTDVTIAPVSRGRTDPGVAAPGVLASDLADQPLEAADHGIPLVVLPDVPASVLAHALAKRRRSSVQSARRRTRRDSSSTALHSRAGNARLPPRCCAFASTGVPTARLSSNDCERRSSASGAIVTDAASYAVIRSRSGSTPASRRYGASGTVIIFTPISTSPMSSVATGSKRVEVLQHLLAAVVRLDASAVESEVVVETMATSKGHAPT